MEPLVTACVFDAQKAMLNHYEKDVLNNSILGKKDLKKVKNLHYAAKSEDHKEYHGCQEPEI
jgi:hypothetical protein